MANQDSTQASKGSSSLRIEPNLELFKELTRNGYESYNIDDYLEARKQFSKSLQVAERLYGANANCSEVATAHKNLATILIKHALYDEVNRHLCIALDIHKKIYGPDAVNEDNAEIYNILGVLNTDKSKYGEAHSHHDKALAMFIEVYRNQPNANTAFTYSNIADLLYEQNMFDEAYESYGKAIDMLEILYPDNAVAPVATQLRWGRLYCKRGQMLVKRGFLSKANKEYQRIAPIVRKMLEASPNNVLAFSDVFNALGDLHAHLFNYLRAQHQYLAAAKMFPKFYGREKPNQALANSVCLLGHISVKRLRLKDALDYYEAALDTVLRIYDSENHPEVGKILNYMGYLFSTLRDYSRSLIHHFKALNIYKECYQIKNHKNVAFTYSAIGDVYCQLGDHDRSHKYNFKSLKINKTIFAQNLSHNISLARNYENIGMTYLEQGNYTQAGAYFGEMCDMMVAIYVGTPEKHEFVRVEYRRALLMAKQSTFAEASAQIKQTISRAQKVSHPDVGKFMRHLGDLESSIENFDEAMKCYVSAHKNCSDFVMQQKSAVEEEARIYTAIARNWFKQFDYDRTAHNYIEAFDRMSAMFGSNANHPEHANIAKGQGDMHYAMYQYSQALFTYQLALDIRETVYKENLIHPDIAEVLYCLGCTYLQFGQYDNSLTHHSRALDIRETIHAGMSHRDLAQSYDGMGTAYQMREEYDRALEYFQKSLKMKQNLQKMDESSIDFVESYTHLGNLCCSQRDYKNAIAYYTKAESMCKGISSSVAYVKLRIGQCYDNVGLASVQRGEFKQAKGVLLTARDIKQEAFKQASKKRASKKMMLHVPYWPSIALSHCYIGSMRYAEAVSISQQNLHVSEEELYRMFSIALESFDKALDQFKLVWAEGHYPDIAMAYTNKALILQHEIVNSARADNYELAFKCHTQALIIREGIYDNETEDHPDIAASYKNIGDVYNLQGHYDWALDSLNTALEKYTSFYYGKLGRPEVASVYESLGTACYKKGDYKQALAHFLKCHEMRVAIYGTYVKYHLELASIHVHLGNVYNKLGQKEESLQHFSMAEQIKTGEGNDTQGC